MPLGVKRIHKSHPEIPQSTIKFTIKMERHCLSNTSLPRSGQPRKLTEEDRGHLYDVISMDPHIKYRDLIDEVDEKVKQESIRRLLNEMDLRKWRQLSRPALCRIYAAKRLQWAKKYENFTPENWTQVCQSDECSVALSTFTRHSEQIQTHGINEKPHGRAVKQTFWADFGESRRTGLVPLDGNLEASCGGVDRFIIEALYRAFLSLSDQEISLCMIMHLLIELVLYKIFWWNWVLKQWSGHHIPQTLILLNIYGN